MGAITTAVIAIGAVVLGWITIEIACKPCLEKGREAIDRSLNPDYDPDDEISDIRAPLNSNPDFTPDLVHTNPTHPSSTTSDVIKAIVESVVRVEDFALELSADRGFKNGQRIAM
ncbi:unnamed protein product [Citrullus colocynthis]|uniref:Outer envelope membrane protein 7 n=1 Tax=Citrullus colocynthis TaxID=252529 RepID=A0ABP0YRS4_9ROSI